MSSSNNFVALEEDIISKCASHERAHFLEDDYRRCLPFRGYFVKFGGYASFRPEILTLEYLAQAAKNDGSAPRVPQVYHSFHREENRMAYVIMEFIPLTEVSNEDLAPMAAQAVRWMRGVPAPDGVVLGPLGPGRAQHRVFKGSKAPHIFTSLEALQRYFNQAVEKLRRRHPETAYISIANEALVLTQSDMHPSNFGVDREGRAVVFDAGMIGWLPESLANYTLLASPKFAGDVAAYLFAPAVAAKLLQSPNLVSMARVRGLLGFGAPADLGLDADGYPKACN